MSAEIIHTWDWDSDGRALFVSVGLGRDQLTLHEYSVGSHGRSTEVTKLDSIDTIDVLECFDYSSSHHGLVGYSSIRGSIHLVDLFNPSPDVTMSLMPKVQRICNDLSFNTSGLLACGFDRVRNDNSIQIWDISVQSKQEQVPLMSMFSNETISCVEFLPSRPTTMLCGGHKLLREVDTRTSGLVSSVATKYAIGLAVNPLDDMSFYSYSESGALALWDRRMMLGSSNVSREPLLLIPRVFNDQNKANGTNNLRRCVRYSHRSVDELAVLHDGGLIRRWLTSTVPGPTYTTSHLSSGLTNSLAPNPTASQGESASLFVNKVYDVKTTYDKVVGFDYALRSQNKQLDFVCIRQSGHVFAMPSKESPNGLYFDPYNTFSMAEPHEIITLSCQEAANNPTSALPDAVDNADHRSRSGTLASRQESGSMYHDGEESESDGASKDSEDESVATQSDDDDDISAKDSKSLLSYQQLFLHDIQRVMQERALRGYSLDPEKNVAVLKEFGKHIIGSGPMSLIAAWNWIKQQKSMQLSSDIIDLNYCGVASLWGELSYDTLATRVKKDISQAVLDDAVKAIVNRLPGDVFVSSECAAEAETGIYRQLCLRLAGWDFGLKELESKLIELESRGNHEKAAGWAAFHGNVERAVESLSRSRKKHLRLMSTAVAGYLVYKDVPTNNIWREQCRRLASEMSMPYLRAIFAYIADGSWLDVLDDGSLPLTERLGIALRFLPRSDLTRYLSRITRRAISNGDLEGLILTGLNPGAVELLQSYLDRTSDVQTASLLSCYGWPRFLDDPHIPDWIAEYRRQLNTWRYFAQRARFDVGRNQLVKSSGSLHSVKSPVPRQVFLRCNHCKTPIGGPEYHESSKNNRRKSVISRNRCPNCNHPLPRCSVCLLPLGPSLEDKSQSDRWPTFCLSCNHGYHSVHANEWFAKYDICPVPNCQCLCGKM